VIGNNTAFGTGALTLNGGNLQSSGTFSVANAYTLGGAVIVSGSNKVTLSGTGNLGANTLTVNNSASTTLINTLSCTGCAVTLNVFTLVLSVSSNTYTGVTTLTAGTLIAGANTAFGSGALALNGGNLQSNGAFSVANAYTLGGA